MADKAGYISSSKKGLVFTDHTNTFPSFHFVFHFLFHLILHYSSFHVLFKGGPGGGGMWRHDGDAGAQHHVKIILV